jgi:hypothetical protein
MPTAPRRGLAALSFCALASLSAVASCGPLEVRSSPVPLAPDGSLRVGGLEYRGGVQLSSGDGRFGGLSDLRVSATGEQITAISDEGHWFTAHLLYNQNGFLTGVTAADVGALRDTSGQPLNGKLEQDAEALAAMPDGSFLVAFERHHRLFRYPPTRPPLRGVPTLVAPPPDLSSAPANEGIEALTTLADGRVFALSENLAVEDGVRGWVRETAGWQPFAYRVSGLLRPSGAARLPSGDIVVLVRGFSLLTGIAVRLEVIAAAEIRRGAVLQGRTLAEITPPLTVDNFEGVDAREGQDGETLVYLLSDDNFSRRQRTLLMMFALREPPSN